jgi:hypothetical protein
MYVSRYMRLIKKRTTHRVLVGLNAAPPKAALDSRIGGRLVSNVVSVTGSQRTREQRPNFGNRRND